MLKIPFRHKPRLMGKADLKVERGPVGRMSKLRKVVTGLVRRERVEGKLQHIDEARGYAERVCSQYLCLNICGSRSYVRADMWYKCC